MRGIEEAIMAKPRARAAASAARTRQQVERMLWLERLRGAAIPGILTAIAVLVWVLGSAGALSREIALFAVGCLGLAICTFFAVRAFIDEGTDGRQATIVAGFAVALLAVSVYSFSQVVYPPPSVASGDLAVDGAPLVVQARGSGDYRLVVEGHLPASSDRATQSESYAIRVERDGAPAVVLSGEFSERWGMRRLGRRGSAPVHVVRDTGQHWVDVHDGETLRISLVSLTPAGTGRVSVRIHPAPAPPTAVLIGSGIALVAAAAWLDAVRGADAEGLTTMLTCVAVLAVASFRRFAPAHPGFGELAFNAAIGGVAGAVTGGALWRVIGARLRKLARR
jgi:hypothetical protein